MQQVDDIIIFSNQAFKPGMRELTPTARYHMILLFFAWIATVPVPLACGIRLLKMPTISAIYGKLRFFLCVL
ncbi:hypothetical protein JYJ56_000747 [Salmonella enterica]|nr:hypothetical protein [Salmonella enterica]